MYPRERSISDLAAPWSVGSRSGDLETFTERLRLLRVLLEQVDTALDVLGPVRRQIHELARVGVEVEQPVEPHSPPADELQTVEDDRL